MRTALACLLVVAAVRVDAVDFERVLIPVVADNTPGAFGSRWQSELFGRNTGDTPVVVKLSPNEICVIPETCFPPGAPHSTFALPYPSAPGGVFVLVERTGADRIRFNLRVYDAARDESFFGVNLPAVRESDFSDAALHVVNVPADTRARATLRIYSSESRASVAVVRIRALDRPSPKPVELVVQLNEQQSFSSFLYPAFGAIQDVAAVLPREWVGARLDIEVEPEPGIRVWAFVSLTNNISQAVSLVLPW
jgi:hypothetical protein